MPIIIKDDAANAVVMTIDNNGRLAFGDGTPIDMLTLNGFGIIDSEGYIVHGIGNAAVIPASGTVTCGFGQSVTVLTIPGVTPLFALDTVAPANAYSVDPAGGPHITPIINSAVQSANPDDGKFTIFNENQATEEFMANPTFARLPNQNSGCRYRYL